MNDYPLAGCPPTLLAPLPRGAGVGSAPAVGQSSPFVDVDALIAGGGAVAPAPTVCRRTDGQALFYAGQVNSVFGDPESGKTWLGLAAVAEALLLGGRALVVDADHNGAAQVVARLLDLGVDADLLANRRHFLLAEPEGARGLTQAIHEAGAWVPTVALIDSIGEVLPILGKSSNSPDDYTDAHRLVLRPLALAGAAVITVDHLPKSAESRQHGPTGTAAKDRAVGGVSLRVSVREAFRPGQGGMAVLTIRKDRPGGLRAASPEVGKAEQPAGVFVLTSGPDGLRWKVSAPEPGDALHGGDASGRGTYIPTEADFALIDAMPETDRVHKKVRTELGVGGSKALAILQAYRERQAAC